LSIFTKIETELPFIPPVHEVFRRALSGGAKIQGDFPGGGLIPEILKR